MTRSSNNGAESSRHPSRRAPVNRQVLSSKRVGRIPFAPFAVPIINEQGQAQVRVVVTDGWRAFLTIQ